MCAPKPFIPFHSPYTGKRFLGFLFKLKVQNSPRRFYWSADSHSSFVFQLLSLKIQIRRANTPKFLIVSNDRLRNTTFLILFFWDPQQMFIIFFSSMLLSWTKEVYVSGVRGVSQFIAVLRKCLIQKPLVFKKVALMREYIIYYTQNNI